MPTPNGPAVSLTGPLLVFSERVGGERTRDSGNISTRRVFVYDLATARYWTAFDYRNVYTDHSTVQPAGTHLIVWTIGQVARLSLAGQIDAVLFEDPEIRAIQVSPDGMHVAILYGWPGTLLVLDAATGAERLRVASDDPALGPLQNGGPSEYLSLGTWHPDGTALSIASSGAGLDPPAILGLDGSIRPLPEGWDWLSPDLRYAVRGEPIGFYTWGRWEVVDVATGEILWTITADEGIQFASRDHWSAESRYLAFKVPAVHGNTTQILDTATGEVGSLTPSILRTLELSSCHRGVASRASSYPFPHPCDLWEEYHGLTDPPDGFMLRGIPLLEIGPVPVPPSPPPREEMVGPLLLYSVGGPYEEVVDGAGGSHPMATRRVIAHDVSTGGNWRVFAYPGEGSLQAAHDGLVAALDRGFLYFSRDGQVTQLSDQRASSLRGFSVSPDGRKVVVDFRGSDDLVVLSLPSGDPILRVENDDLIAATGRILSEDEEPIVVLNYDRSGRMSTWLSDSAAFVALVGEKGHTNPLWLLGAMITLDGDLHIVSCEPDWAQGFLLSLSCLSPDGRYAARGRSLDHRREFWEGFDIVDLTTGRVLQTVDDVRIPDEEYREWAAPDQFAWSSRGRWLFDEQRSLFSDGPVEISVLDITTGAIEIVDSTEYLARFHPPPRAVAACPQDRVQPCGILLDGAVVGGGHWPTIIGIVTLD